MMQRVCRLICLAPMLIGLAGCGEASTSQAVTGTVSYQGAPLTNGALAFYPAEGRPIQAAIQSDGAYEADLPPGEYRVTVIVGVDLPPGWKDGDPLPPPSVKLPPAYTSRVRTPLVANVSAAQAEPVDFTL